MKTLGTGEDTSWRKILLVWGGVGVTYALVWALWDIVFPVVLVAGTLAFLLGGLFLLVAIAAGMWAALTKTRP